jgi:hypothetical protein
MEVLVLLLSEELDPMLENSGHSKLDADISMEDSGCGVRQLNSGRTSGHEGYSAELLGYSTNI